jgi:tetratricopeptide (TPR) repeat protein
MNKYFKTDFIKETPQKILFSDLSGQNFFIEWCKINDGIMPQFISRQEREKIDKKELLEAKQENKDKQILLLPKDLQLWEISKIIETIENDTFQNKPERIGKRSRELFELGIMLEKAAIYINKYCKNIPTAQKLAQEFYNYGLSLQTGEKKQENIKEEILSEEEKSKIDKWLLWETTYKKAIERLGDNPSQERIETKRKELLNTYFTALERKWYEGEWNTPWAIKKGPIKNIQDKAKTRIIHIFETPEREIKKTIFERGQEKLITNIVEAAWDNETNTSPKKLYETLQIDKLKKELDIIRELWNIEIISDKELEIAKKIQKEIDKYTYEGISNNPAEMVKDQQINCLWSAILGIWLLKELKIKCIPALSGNYDHVITLLITSNWDIYWQDFTPWQGEWENIKNYKKIQKNIQLENSINKENTTKKNIIDLENEKYQKSISINIELDTIENLEKEKIFLYETENALIGAILNNIGNISDHSKAITIFKEGIGSNPNHSSLYNGLGVSLSNLGRHKEAINIYKQGISIDSQNSALYNGLGNSLKSLGKYKDAIDTYREGISINPENYILQNNLGIILCNIEKYREAIDVYKKIPLKEMNSISYLSLWDALEHLGRRKEALNNYEKYIFSHKENNLLKEKILKKIVKIKRIIEIEEQITKLKIDFKYEMRKRISKIKKQ